MQQVNSLSWLALSESNLLTAAVSVNFSIDPNWQVALGGTYSGVQVKPITVRVSNIANINNCTITIGTQIFTVPPFTDKWYALPEAANFVSLAGTAGAVGLLFYNKAQDTSQSTTDFLAIIKQVALQIANFAVDSGVADAYVGVLVPPLTIYGDGTFITLLVANNNSGAAASLKMDALAAIPILYKGANPPANSMVAGEISILEVRANQFRLLNTWAIPSTTFTAKLAADVFLDNIANFFDGPSVAQGAMIKALAMGTVTLAGGINDQILVKLWDGTTVIDSTRVELGNNFAFSSATLCGVISNPAGNIRLSCRDTSSVSGVIRANASGQGFDSTITVVRLA